MSDDSAVKIHVVCPECGSPNVCCDAAARWDFETQDWELSSAMDDKTCDDCGYDSHSFAEVADGDLTDAQRRAVEGDEYKKPGRHERQLQ